MEEIWKNIKNFENYQVSNKGRIKNIRNNKIVNLHTNSKNGYVYVMLSNKNKKKCARLHRLVAEEFIPNLKNKPVVNHIDGNKLNNQADNLEWCTQKENVNHAIIKLGVKYGHDKGFVYEGQRKKVKRSDGMIFNSIKEAKEYMKNKNLHIAETCRGKHKTTGGYGWEYYKG